MPTALSCRIHNNGSNNLELLARGVVINLGLFRLFWPIFFLEILQVITNLKLQFSSASSCQFPYPFVLAAMFSTPTESERD